MNILELTLDELTAEIRRRYGRGRFHAAAVYREIFRRGNLDFREIPEFRHSRPMAGQLQADLKLTPGQVVVTKQQAGLTKFITRLTDGLEVESVIIPMANHTTLCISSQVGCKMGCTFCETAQMGFLRNLRSAEIVGQVYTAKVILEADIKNVVFMGMGEPLDNFDHVVKAIRVLTDPRGLNFATRHITVSTAGRIDGLEKLAALNWPRLNLAVSLNAPNDRLRSKIMPINRTTPMGVLQQALLDYPLKKSGAFLIEYVLIKDFNDSRKHAAELATFLRPLKTKVNVIAYNPRPGSPLVPPGEEDIQRFVGWLVQENVFVRRRTTKGRELMAACGQLGNRRLRSHDRSDGHLGAGVTIAHWS